MWVKLTLKFSYFDIQVLHFIQPQAPCCILYTVIYINCMFLHKYYKLEVMPILMNHQNIFPWYKSTTKHLVCKMLAAFWKGNNSLKPECWIKSLLNSESFVHADEIHHLVSTALKDRKRATLVQVTIRLNIVDTFQLTLPRLYLPSWLGVGASYRPGCMKLP